MNTPTKYIVLSITIAPPDQLAKLDPDISRLIALHKEDAVASAVNTLELLAPIFNLKSVSRDYTDDEYYNEISPHIERIIKSTLRLCYRDRRGRGVGHQGLNTIENMMSDVYVTTRGPTWTPYRHPFDTHVVINLDLGVVKVIEPLRPHSDIVLE